MPKIVFITPSIKTGGGNRVFFELANILCCSYDVAIIYPNNSADTNTFTLNPAVRLQGVGRTAHGKLAKLNNLLRLIRYVNRNHSKDIVIYTDPIFAILAAKGLKIKKLYRFIQADDYRIFDDGMVLGQGIVLKLYKTCCLWAYRKRHIRYLFNSRYTYDQYCSDSGLRNIPFDLVHPAINLTVFRQESSKVISNRPSICLVARKHPWKGLQTFIKAFNTLPEETRTRLGPIRLISHDDLSSYDTQGMEIIKPKSDLDIATVYKKSDIFISTSWWEGFGLPPLEAMACRCACIISASGGVNEYAINNHNCIMFTPKNVTELQQALCKLADNKEFRESLATQALHTSSRFSWEISAQQLISILIQA